MCWPPKLPFMWTRALGDIWKPSGKSPLSPTICCYYGAVVSFYFWLFTSAQCTGCYSSDQTRKVHHDPTWPCTAWSNLTFETWNLLYQIKSIGILQNIPKAVDFKFSVDVLPVLFHRVPTDKKFFCNARVVHPLSQELQHFHFPHSEGIKK